MIHFVSGLPRSGSTLLMNLLGQNPRFHVTGTSGILDILFGVRNHWDQLDEFKASPNEKAKKRVLQAILSAYYPDIPIILDKSRGWLAYLEMAEELLERKVKVLVPVRDLREVLASYEKLYRAESKLGQMQDERQFYFEFQTVAGRCNIWMRGDKPIGIAFNRIVDAIQRGYRDRILFVQYEKLTTNPENEIQKIYEFLGEPIYGHDFSNIEQLTNENDAVFGFKTEIHKIRRKIEPLIPQSKEILGPCAEKYKGPYIWNL